MLYLRAHSIPILHLLAASIARATLRDIFLLFLLLSLFWIFSQFSSFYLVPLVSLGFIRISSCSVFLEFLNMIIIEISLSVYWLTCKMSLILCTQYVNSSIQWAKMSSNDLPIIIMTLQLPFNIQKNKICLNIGAMPFFWGRPRVKTPTMSMHSGLRFFGWSLSLIIKA